MGVPGAALFVHGMTLNADTLHHHQDDGFSLSGIDAEIFYELKRILNFDLITDRYVR